MTYSDASQCLDCQLRQRISRFGGDLASISRLQIRCCVTLNGAAEVSLGHGILLHSRAFVILAMEAAAFEARGPSPCYLCSCTR